MKDPREVRRAIATHMMAALVRNVSFEEIGIASAYSLALTSYMLADSLIEVGEEQSKPATTA